MRAQVRGPLSLREFFHTSFPHNWSDLHTACPELGTIMLALKIWGPKFTSQNIKIRCDNIASVNCLNSGKLSVSFMQQCLREIAYIAAKHDFQIHVKYIASKANKIPELLSRWDTGESIRRQFNEVTRGMNLKEIHVHQQCFNFTNDW